MHRAITDITALHQAITAMEQAIPAMQETVTGTALDQTPPAILKAVWQRRSVVARMSAATSGSSFSTRTIPDFPPLSRGSSGLLSLSCEEGWIAGSSPAIARSGRRSRSREAGASLIEALDLVPDFLEELVANDLLDAFSGGVVRVELLRQKALERSIPDVADIPSIVAGFGRRFEQLRLRHQGTGLPALPLLADRGQQHAQSLDLLHDLPIVDEIQLMQVVQLMQEELHVPRVLGENQAAFLFRHGIMMHELLESA